MGYIDQNIHGNYLPYIHVSHPSGKYLKILIDTGASKSFINPEYVNPKCIQTLEKPIEIKAILNSYNIDSKISLPIFPEFNQLGYLDFLVFKFHNYFDGLLGIDNLQKLQISINTSQKCLSSPYATINLLDKPNYMSGKHMIPSHSKLITKLPVDIQNGDILLPNTFISNNFIIQEGVYRATNWHIIAPITNISDQDKTFYIEQPLKVELLNHETITFDENQICPSPPTSLPIDSLLRLEHLNSEEKKEILSLCQEFDDIFFREGQNLSFTNQIKHHIHTRDELPCYTKSYRYPQIHKEEIKRQLDKMLHEGIIRPSFSPWSSPIWIVPKKSDASGKQKWRLVVDYRRLNEKTVDDRYPIPNITEILDKLGKCMYFSTLDLTNGFHQIEVNPKDIPKTAFSVDYGHFEYVRMPFGLKNAPSTFQRVMDNVLRELQGTICLVYMDDIIIYSTSLNEHISNLRKVFSRLRTANLKVQLDKSEFLHKEIAFLGHLITTEGVKPNPEKISAIQNYPIPKTVKQIKGFLGLLGYYRKFILDFAKITKPMTKCLRKGAVIQLTPEYLECFETCKNLLTSDPILAYPDFEKPFVLTTDASDFAIGAVLSQGPIGQDKPICYASRTLTVTEEGYSTIEKETLAIIWATKYFRPYLFGRKFKIVTDHQPLTWLMSLKENNKLVRWRLRLEEFDFEVVHKPGRFNCNADALSRIKIETQDKKSNTLLDTFPCLSNPDVNVHEQNTNENNSSTHTNVSSTQHSGENDGAEYIRISENPINDFSQQLIIELNDKRPNRIITDIFQKRRQTFRSPIFSNAKIIEIFKSYLPPHKLTAIYCADDDTFVRLQEIYVQYFSESKRFKLIRCTKLLRDIEDEDEQDNIIQDYHNKSHHRGIQETFSHLRREYYFPTLKSKITYYINNCKICNTVKYDRQPPKQNYSMTQTPKAPLEIVHMDIFYLNSEHMLTLLDKFSKFGQAYTLKSRNPLHIKQQLGKFFSSYGLPKLIVTDSETSFRSISLRQYLEEANINFHYTSIRSSNSNSPVERFHSTLLETYRIIRMEFPGDTHKLLLSKSITTYNNAIHSVTKYTPFELFFGRKYDANFERNRESLETHRQKLYDEVNGRVLEAKTKLIEKLNKGREEAIQFEPNDEVFEIALRLNNKLTPKFKATKVKTNLDKNFIDIKDRKIHKQKIKRPLKLQIRNNSNIHPDDRNTGPGPKPGTSRD